MKCIALFLVAAVSLLAGCKDMGNLVAAVPPVERTPQLPGGPNYAPGVVVVLFVDSMTYPSIIRFLAGLSLDVRFISADSAFDAWIGVLSGDPSSYAAYLASSPMVEWADVRGYQGGPGEGIHAGAFQRHDDNPGGAGVRRGDTGT